MKLLIAIVNKRDIRHLTDALIDNDFRFTEIGSTGGFLRAGNVTLLIGVDDERVPPVLELIQNPRTGRGGNDHGGRRAGIHHPGRTHGRRLTAAPSHVWADPVIPATPAIRADRAEPANRADRAEPADRADRTGARH